MKESKVLLIKEFRSPVRNTDGFVYELPGGSSPKLDENPLVIASRELEEETGISIEANRFKNLGSRQMISTLSTHHAQLFQIILTDKEIKTAEKIAASEQCFGVNNDSERTYLEVKTIGEIMKEQLVDWSMLGMIFQAVCDDLLCGGGPPS